ncbi:MAG: hypothetical protein ABSE73_21305 [Planctomycetota bacterium]
MKTKNPEILWDGPEVERLRKVRRAIERRCKTFDGLCAYLERLDKQGHHTMVHLPKRKQTKIDSPVESPPPAPSRKGRGETKGD